MIDRMINQDLVPSACTQPLLPYNATTTVQNFFLKTGNCNTKNICAITGLQKKSKFSEFSCNYRFSKKMPGNI